MQESLIGWVRDRLINLAKKVNGGADQTHLRVFPSVLYRKTKYSSNSFFVSQRYWYFNYFPGKRVIIFQICTIMYFLFQSFQFLIKSNCNIRIFNYVLIRAVCMCAIADAFHLKSVRNRARDPELRERSGLRELRSNGIPRCYYQAYVNGNT